METENQSRREYNLQMAADISEIKAMLEELTSEPRIAENAGEV